MNKPRSIPTTIAEPTFSLCPSACFWSYHPCSHDSLHDPPNIFSPPFPRTRLSSSSTSLRSLPPTIATPPPLLSSFPPPLPAFTFPLPSTKTLRNPSLLLFSNVKPLRLLSDSYGRRGEESTIPGKSPVFTNTGRVEGIQNTSPRLILSRTSSEIYNVGNISILCKSIEVSWVSRVYNRDLVCSIITGHGCKRCFSTMDRKHGFIKLLCRPDQRLTNATCPRHAFNPELGKPGYIHVYIYI